MKTIIEAGHYYEINGPSVLSMKGWEIGKELVADEPGSELAVFIDDYHQSQAFIEPGDTFLSQDESADALNMILSEADHVFSEAGIAKTAPQKISELLDDGLIKLKKGVLSVGGVRLGCLRR